MLRPLDEFLWVLRRHGLTISVAQATDAMRAVALVGWEDEASVREALAIVVLKHARERGRFDALFDGFFRAEKAHARDLFGRLRGAGLDDETVEKIRTLLEGLAGQDEGPGGEAARWLLGVVRGAGLDGAMASGEVRRLLGSLTGRRQVGYFAQQVMGQLGLSGASGRLDPLRMWIEGELGGEAGARVMELLTRELELARSEVRLAVEQAAVTREAEETEGARPFEGLDAGEFEEVRRAVRVLGERLRGAARARARRARRGRPDAHATLRAAMRTGGVPMVVKRRRRVRRRPRLWVVCDVSESVRAASVFLLEFVAVAHELFERTRSFVFVSEVGEATALFERETPERALAAVLRGGVVSVSRNSNYGRALRQFEERHGRELDRRCTLVIVGDGRTNYQDGAVEVVARLRERARALVWLCPEPASRWGTADSRMPQYAREASEVLMATTAEELEEAARALVRRR